MASWQKGAKREPSSTVEEMETAAAEEKGDQKYPVVKMTDIDDEALTVMSRMAGVSISSEEESQSPVGADTTVGQPTGTLPTGEAMSSGSEREDALKRKAKRKAKSNKVTVPIKIPKGGTATAGQPAGSEPGDGISAAHHQTSNPTNTQDLHIYSYMYPTT